MTTTELPASSDRFLLGASSRQGLPYVDTGAGVFLTDESGMTYLDGSSGALAANLGHGRTDLADVLRTQAARVSFAHRTHLRNRPVEQLAQVVADWAPGHLTQSMFVSSGSDANELAISLAVRYWAGRGEPRARFLARDRSYHGATLGALSMTGLVERHGAMRPLLLDIARLPSPAASMTGVEQLELLDGVERAFHGSTPPAAVLIEVVSGTSGGAIVPPMPYLERITNLCRETGALLIVDEVMSGFGRTGTAFASEQLGIEPDVLTFGKGVSGGYAPLAGVIVTDEVATHLATAGGTGLGHTYMDVPITAAVGLAATRMILESSFLDNVQKRGVQLRDGLENLRSEWPTVLGQPRGIGLMNAVEVQDYRHAGMPELLDAMRRSGLLLYPAVNHHAMANVLTVMIAPPLTVDETEISELLSRFREGLKKFVTDSRSNSV